MTLKQAELLLDVVIALAEEVVAKREASFLHNDEGNGGSNIETCRDQALSKLFDYGLIDQ